MIRKKVTDICGEGIAEKNNVVMLKVNRPLTKHEHDLLIDRMKEQEMRTGIKIVVIPYSVDHLDGES